VGDPSAKSDPWRWPALLVWLLFLLAGLVPEPVFFALREAGGVLTQDALVNSAWLVTLGLAGYMGVFALRRCLEAGLSPAEAQDRALLLGVLGLMAFFNNNLMLFFTAHTYPLMQTRFQVYLVGIGKLLAWWYLLSLLIRYYAFADHTVFARIPAIFPSTRRRQADRMNQAPAECEQGPSALAAGKPLPDSDGPASRDDHGPSQGLGQDTQG